MNTAQYSYFFDTNIYRNLTTSEEGTAIINFNNAIKKSEILKNNASQTVLYKMTAFSLIEALGVTIPNPKIVLPEELIGGSNVKRDLIAYVSNEAKKYFSSLPQIKKDNLLKKAEEQSKYTTYAAKIIEDNFINRALSSPTIEEYLNSCLLFDYICKYDYPKWSESEIMNVLLIPSFFIRHPADSGFSKFRIIKKIWDMIYPGLYTNSDYPKEILEEMSKAMKLKRDRDYLDCEIIHLAIFGDHDRQTTRPVVTFTCDDVSTVTTRLRVVKSVMQVFLDLLAANNNNSYKDEIKSWKQGIVVFCNIDGTFKEIIEVEKLEAFI